MVRPRSRRKQETIKDRVEFVKHKFEGTRFDDHTLDVDVLPEIIAYKALVVAVAKHLFFQENGDRQNLSPGFAKAFDLAIKTTNGGSFDMTLVQSVNTLPIMRLFAGTDPAVFHQYTQSIYTRARDTVSDAIGAACDNKDTGLPPSIARLFDSFGKQLRGDEKINIRKPGEVDGVRYTREVRAKILRSAKSEYDDAIDINGKVIAASVEAQTFRVKIDDGPTVDGPFPSEYEARVTKALRNHESTRARVLGVGSFSSDGSLKKILSVEEIIVVQSLGGAHMKLLQIDAQTEGLRAPQDLGEAGVVTIDPDCIEWVCDALHDITDDAQVALPYLYATPESNIQAEWTFGPWEVSACFDFDARAAQLCAVNVKTGFITNDAVGVDDVGAYDRMIGFVNSFASAMEV